jgi:hypothetical protein
MHTKHLLSTWENISARRGDFFRGLSEEAFVMLRGVMLQRAFH